MKSFQCNWFAFIYVLSVYFFHPHIASWLQNVRSFIHSFYFILFLYSSQFFVLNGFGFFFSIIEPIDPAFYFRWAFWASKRSSSYSMLSKPRFSRSIYHIGAVFTTFFYNFCSSHKNHSNFHWNILKRFEANKFFLFFFFVQSMWPIKNDNMQIDEKSAIGREEEESGHKKNWFEGTLNGYCLVYSTWIQYWGH